MAPERDEAGQGYDPERVRQAIRESAGAMKGVDRDKLLSDLREQGSEGDQTNQRRASLTARALA